MNKEKRRILIILLTIALFFLLTFLLFNYKDQSNFESGIIGEPLPIYVCDQDKPGKIFYYPVTTNAEMELIEKDCYLYK